MQALVESWILFPVVDLQKDSKRGRDDIAVSHERGCRGREQAPR